MSGGLIEVAVRVPRLALDRPFTYRLPDGMDAGLGSLVQVPFHGRAVQGWVLGAPGADEPVPARLADVRKLLSAVRFFDGPMLELCRRLAHRYVAPLPLVIDRAVPPRVVSEEGAAVEAAVAGIHPRDARPLAPGAFLLRVHPEDELALLTESVERCLSGGRDAIVLIPEADPEPEPVRRLVQAFGDAVCVFAGGEPRERYRDWLDICGGRYRVVVGTRPAAFAPLRDPGLLWVTRDAHAGHREPRSPSWHVRDVALLRAEIAGGTAVVAGPVPSAEAWAAGLAGLSAARSGRGRAWPIVEAVKPGPEGRAPRLVQALRSARSGFLLSGRSGYGVARVCRSCGRPAACARCSGILEQRKGSVVCGVCGAAGVCGHCGGSDFGVQRRGSERVAEWASKLAGVPVRESDGPPDGDAITVGTPAAVPDAGPRRLDVVGILDADPMLRRPGLSAPEQVLATWFEAASWARPRPEGRVIVETTQPGHPAIQALVRGNPEAFLARETARRTEAGFPPGHPVFRVACRARIAEELGALAEHTLVSGSADDRLCLVTVSPEGLDAFARRVRGWARAGDVLRVDAEPHL